MVKYNLDDDIRLEIENRLYFKLFDQTNDCVLLDIISNVDNSIREPGVLVWDIGDQIKDNVFFK